jgi:hypothetical protein
MLRETLAPSPKPLHPSAESEPLTALSTLPPSGSLAELWVRMAARYGHAWTSQYARGDDDALRLAMAEWRETLAGVTSAQVQHGLEADALRGAEWPPSSTHFRALCFAIPSFAATRFEMQHGDEPRTPFGLLCWRFVDPFRMRTATQDQADRIARDAYELAKTHVMAGGELPVVPELLAKPDPQQREAASRETAERTLREMAEKLGTHVEVEVEAEA